MKRFTVVSCLVGLLCASRAMACDLCSVHAASEAQGGSGQGFYGGAAEQFTRFDTLQSSGRTVSNDGENLNSLTSQLFVGYNIHPRFGVQLNLPIIYREYHRQFASAADGHVFSPATHSEGGLGDASLIGNLRAYEYLSEDLTFNWTVLGGIKFPTGASHHLNPDETDFSTGIGGHDLAMGSGSYDGLVGTGVFARWKRAFLTANMQYAIRSEGA
jgi:hypothetical protein